MTAKIAIVGAGPSGCFTAQALLKLDPSLAVDVIDAQPTPFGLVRYGVAADHQGTKSIARQFARVFTRQNAQFFGNVTIGEQISLDQLFHAYDAVVLAAGLSRDRRLGISGDDTQGVIGSRDLTRALYEHPDASTLPNLGAHPVIIGTGNVAIDILRLLAKTPDGLHGSDLGQGPTDWLAAQHFEKITIVGRSTAADARCSPVMLKELAELSNINVSVRHQGAAHSDQGADRVDALVHLAGSTTGVLPVEFRFESLPVAIEPQNGASSGQLTLHVDTPDGPQSLSASSVITAIGFMSDGALDRAELLHAAADPISPRNRVYTIGWFRGGPAGAIPQCRSDAQILAKRIVSELEPKSDRIGRAVFSDLPDVVDFTHWEHIDRLEVSAAPQNRCRQKISNTAELLRPSNLQDT